MMAYHDGDQSQAVTGNSLRQMKLFDTTTIYTYTRHYNWSVTRVPGGWIMENVQSLLPVFVPIDNEFEG